MYILLYITLALFSVYAILILYYERAWKNIPVFNFQQFDSLQANIKISVIIPARNEEDQIGICLQSLLQQTYPAALLEIIVINDHSTDNTEAVVRSFNQTHIKIINLAEHLDGKSLNAYKKKAIEIAIGTASGDLIVTTDADCTAPPDWIKCLAAFHYRYKAAFIAAPVKITSKPYLLSVFQSLDFLTLQGITGASVHKKFHSMCNGANLAYEKKAFYEAGGFKGIDNIASGDDMLLMHKIFTLHPGRVFFLKSESAIVSTLPTHSWKAFFNQRIRWASKADKYEDKKMFGVLVLVYFFNVILLVFLLVGLWNLHWLLLFFLLITAKTLLEFSFVRRVATFFRQQNLMIYFPFVQPLHILYTVIAGWLGKFGTYEWKGRKVH